MALLTISQQQSLAGRGEGTRGRCNFMATWPVGWGTFNQISPRFHFRPHDNSIKDPRVEFWTLSFILFHAARTHTSHRRPKRSRRRTPQFIVLWSPARFIDLLEQTTKWQRRFLDHLILIIIEKNIWYFYKFKLNQIQILFTKILFTNYRYSRV